MSTHHMTEGESFQEENHHPLPASRLMVLLIDQLYAPHHPLPHHIHVGHVLLQLPEAGVPGVQHQTC